MRVGKNNVTQQRGVGEYVLQASETVTTQEWWCVGQVSIENVLNHPEKVELKEVKKSVKPNLPYALHGNHSALMTIPMVNANILAVGTLVHPLPANTRAFMVMSITQCLIYGPMVCVSR